MLAIAFAAVLMCLAASEGAQGATKPGLTITFLPSTLAAVGQPAVLPVRISNTWTVRAVGMTLRVTAPAWVKLERQGCARRGVVLTCPLRSLAAGAAVTVRIRVTTTRVSQYEVVARLTARPAVAQAAPTPSRSLSAAAPFRSGVAAISPALARRMTGVSWRPGCPVPLADLRLVTVSFWGFDSRSHTGTLVVHRSVADRVVGVMGRLYRSRFPIRRMTPVDAYGGDDFRSIEADNTSAFNCRPATGSTHWSEHAYGQAIDLDPLENPYVSGGTTSHPASRRYLDRSLLLPGMIHAGDVVVRAFAAAGWGWGGLWNGTRDYQHFSVNGR